MKRALVIAIAFLFLYSPAGANTDDMRLSFSQISTQEGLSQNTVRAILEDEKGFIWAGTLDGLNRYDGYQLVSYKPQPGNIHSLADHRVKDIFRDSRGYLWIKTYKNEFSCYDPVTDSFKPYAGRTTQNRPLLYRNISETSSGEVWLWGDGDNCLRIVPDGESFATTLFHTGKQDTRFFLEDSKGEIWIGGDYGLSRIKGDGRESFYEDKYIFTRGIEADGSLFFTTRQSTIVEYDLRRRVFREISDPAWKEAFIGLAPMGGNELMLNAEKSGVLVFNAAEGTIFQPDWARELRLTRPIGFITDTQGGIWIHNRSGIVWYYNPAGGKVRRIELIPPDIAAVIDEERYNILVDSEGLYWITTYGNGIFCYDPRTEKLRNYLYSANRNSPASDYLLSITEDRAGNIWVGSEYAGIIKIVKSPYPVQVVRPEQETSVGKNNNVRSVYIDPSDRVWIGTKNGSLYLYDKELSSGVCLYKDLNPYVLTEDGQNRLWVGTKGNGLSIIDVATGREIGNYRHESHDEHSLSYNQVFNILRDSKDRMWIGTFGRGVCLARETDQGITFDRFFSGAGVRNYIRYMYEDSRGRIWLATSNGVIRFAPEELLVDPEAYDIYSLNLKDSLSINANDIKTIFEDSRGWIWIGTAGGGLCRFIEAEEGGRERFVAYMEADGLAGNIISGILEDQTGSLWISTENGISRFDVGRNNFTVYRFSDKTYGNHFNENANITDRDGNMYWGTLDGLLVFNPEQFQVNENPLPVTFTNFFIYDQKAEVGAPDSPLTRSIGYSDAIRLKHFQNTFTVEFSSLSFKDPAKNRYTYLLQNYDKQWSAVSGDNTATYKNLPPGKYRFMVRGANSDGIWNEEVQSLEIMVAPPWWKSGWAYLVYFLLLAGAVVIAVRLFYKFNTLNNNIRVEKELTSHKLRFFTNVSHEFRTPLTIIRSVAENLDNQPDTSEYARRQIGVLSRNSTILTRLIDQLLEFRKLQNNVLTLNLEHIDMVAFARDIFQGFTEIADQKKIGYFFVCTEQAHMMFVDRRKIDKVVYNLLSNAFKFTPSGGSIRFRLEFDEMNKNCLIAVEDTGPGIEKEKQELLFSRFMQINFSYDGTGVGLSLVKEFVDVHKGRVWYGENEEQGGGSVFSVELSTDPETYKGENFVSGMIAQTEEVRDNPASLPPVTEEEEIQMPEIDDSTLSNYKMLVIDDNDDIREFLMEEFSRYFQVDVAENGEKGHQKAIDTNPDLIICDVMMPGMDGFEVTRRLRDDFQTCHIPIILLTAHSSTEHQLEGIQSGADAYITKPFSIRYLVARVFKLIEQREQLKKRFSSEYVLGGTLVTGTNQDKKFVDQINSIVEENLDDPEFTVGRFAELAGQRRTLFYKKIKGITGLSPNDFIKAKRLNRAAELLLQGDFTVSEVSYKVGFDDPLYFSKCFKAQYNCSPSKYASSISGADPS